jgi:hypothetical protein
MKRIFNAAFLSAVLLGTLQNLALAQAPGGPAPESVKKLYYFDGKWQGKATMTMNGQSQTFDYFMDMKKDANGWGLAYHEKGLIPNAPPYMGFGAITTDLNDNMIHIFTVSNYGDVHDHKGSWIDDKRFKLQYNGTMEGKPMVEDMECEVLGKDKWKVYDKVTVGGEVFQTMEVILSRPKKG